MSVTNGSTTPPLVAPTTSTSPPSSNAHGARTNQESLRRKLSKHVGGIASRHGKSGHRQQLIQQIDDHPRGYPQLAAFINSDENFLIARKYGYLRSRVLLYRQDELSVLERDLVALDADDEEKRPLALQSRKHDEQTDKDPVYSRKVLMQKIDDKLKEYDDVISRTQTYISLKYPTRRNVRSFVDWNQDYKPLTKEESSYLEHQDDFVSLYDFQESEWLDNVVEDTLSWCLPSNIMKRLFTSPELLTRTYDPHLRLVSKRRIDMVVRLVLVVTIVALIIGPSAVLFLVKGHSSLKISLILVFTLIFAVALSVCTKAKNHEMLAATATYAAVLVVFLGNASPS